MLYLYWAYFTFYLSKYIFGIIWKVLHIEEQQFGAGEMAWSTPNSELQFR